jgi:hypothetical protein
MIRSWICRVRGYHDEGFLLCFEESGYKIGAPLRCFSGEFALVATGIPAVEFNLLWRLLFEEVKHWFLS